jgi:phospholipid/cholesterol/gamma-HCH transport system ATP-binding protein
VKEAGMLEIENLSKEFEGRQVLEDDSLSVRDREVLTIIGMSGTGKTVLLKIIIGLLAADSGSIRLDGEEIGRFSEREYNERVRGRIGMVFQRGALWDSMTVEENVELALRLRRSLSPYERRRLVAESLEMVGLGRAGKAYPEEMSGGMIKRAAIARAIVTRPKYLLYDEPTTGLDPVLTNMMNDLITRLNRELATTSLIVSHDVHQIPGFSDRVAMLHRGRIVATCPASRMWDQDNAVLNAFLHGRMELI